MKKRRYILRMLAVLVVLTVVAQFPVLVTRADGPPPGLKMEIQPAFDGYFKYGEWLLLWADLENTGADQQVEIRVRVTGNVGSVTYAVPAALPTGSRKRIPVYVLPNNYSHELEVLLVKGDNQLLSQKIPVKPQPNITYLVGLVVAERGPLSMITTAKPSGPGQERKTELVDLAPAGLPERLEALRSFDCIVLNNVDTSSLTPGQRQALEGWVRQGGRLVIGGGAGARRTVAGLPESLLPLAPRSEVEVETLPGLVTFAGAEAIRVPGPFVVAVGEEIQGHTLATQDDMSLVHEQVVGEGYVDFVALDLAASPFDAWTGTSTFWERLVLSKATYPQEIPPDTSIRQMRASQMGYILSNLPSLDLPSVKGLGLLLAIYVVLVGPLNYLVLRRRKQLHAAWITIPVITVAFSVGAFGLGYAMRGNDLILNKIVIAGLQPGGTTNVNTYLGIFSPARQSYEIEVAGDGLLSPLNPDDNPFRSANALPGGELVFVQGNPGRVRGLNVNQWSMQALMSENTWPDLGRIVGDLQLDGETLTGTVRNETGVLLTDVVLIYGNHFVRLDDLGPGEEVEASMNMADLLTQSIGPPLGYRLFEDQFNQPVPGGPSREAQLKQGIVDSLFLAQSSFEPWLSSIKPIAATDSSPGSLMLLGWFDQAPSDVRVGGREPAQQTTGLLYVPLTFTLSDTSHITLAPGFLKGALVEMPIDGGICGSPGTTAIFLGQGQVVYEFNLSEYIHDGTVDQLVVFIGTDGGWGQPPDTTIYNWDSEAWSQLENPILGRNVISDVEGLVSENSIVRVRLSSGSNRGGCLFLELGFQGTK